MIDFHTSPDRNTSTGNSPSTASKATLAMSVDPEHPFADGYELKLNSYDLGVDIELRRDPAAALRASRGARSSTVTSGVERVFCAGANIRMLGGLDAPLQSELLQVHQRDPHLLEDLAENSGVSKTICAVNGPCAGGGYELALACDEIHLIDDGNSTVALPEVPLLGVLPGTGGLTRLVDKRKVRRDLADVFSTLAEGVRGKKAVKWNLVDGISQDLQVPRRHRRDSRQDRRACAPRPRGQGLPLAPPRFRGRPRRQRLRLQVRRGRDRPFEAVATLTVHGPDECAAEDRRRVSRQAARTSLGDPLLPRARRRCSATSASSIDETNSRCCEDGGDRGAILEVEKNLAEHRDHWLVNEIVLNMARVCAATS
jgi:benzoyl-CoA-dihydrodiol lyase